MHPEVKPSFINRPVDIVDVEQQLQTTSLEDLQDEEEEKSLAPTRCHKYIKATWSYVVAVCSL